MAKKSDSFESYEEKIASVKLDRYSRSNLIIPDHNETLNELIAEGNRLIADEESEKKKLSPAIKDDPKKLESKLALKSKNPYIRAKAETLEKMSIKERETLEKMDSGEIPKDKRYDDFVKKITDLGDKYSEK